ncbi:MAG TPA: hypothetical protein VHR16_11765 [Candidatus Limnocylindrales bacterium]|nr:hypothetical protein [Candidatus Limnocylindrales bacterium]
MTIDVGTGDGRAVLDAAAREPETLVLGLDASAAAMAAASRRAAGPARKGGRPNARFVLTSAEAAPAPLLGTANLVTVQFPWGSLLRGCLGLDPAVAAGVAGLVASNGTLELLLAPAPRDGLAGLPTDAAGVIAAAAATFAPSGFEMAAGREATATEIEASGSSWAKRLAAGQRHGKRNGNGAGDRTVTLVRLVRRVRR